MNANDLQIAVIKGDDAMVLSVSGRVSVDSSPKLRNQLLAALRAGTVPAVIIVDLAKTPYVDCSGIATLIEALKFARQRKVDLRLTGLQGRPKKLFEITGVLCLFEGSSHATASSSTKEC